MHKAVFTVRYTLEGQVVAETVDIGRAKAEIQRDVMRGVSLSSALTAMMPARVKVEVELKESLVVPQLQLVK